MVNKVVRKPSIKNPLNLQAPVFRHISNGSIVVALLLSYKLGLDLKYIQLYDSWCRYILKNEEACNIRGYRLTHKTWRKFNTQLWQFVLHS